MIPQQRDLPELAKRSVAPAAVVCTPSDAVAQQVARRLDIGAKPIVVTPLGERSHLLGTRRPTKALCTTLGLPQQYPLFVDTAQPRRA